MRIHREHLFEDLSEVMPFMALMFIVGKAVGIHPWEMQDHIMKAEYKISPEANGVKLADLRRYYEGSRGTRIQFPSFDAILEKVAWIAAAPEMAKPPDDYMSRMNSTILNYDIKYLKKNERIHKRHD